MTDQLIDLPSGRLLCDGRYRIEKELNRGGTAVVYAAHDMLCGSYVALKVRERGNTIGCWPIDRAGLLTQVMHGPEQVPLKVIKREASLLFLFR